MIARVKLLQLIEQAVQVEEHLISSYSSYCLMFSEQADLNPCHRNNSEDIITQILADSRKHRQMLENLAHTIRINHEQNYF